MHLAHCTLLKDVPYIDLAGNLFDDDACASIDSILANNHTRFISIARNNFTEKTIVFVAKQLERRTYAENLRSVDFSGNSNIAEPAKLMHIFADALHQRRAAAEAESDSDDSADSEISASASVRRYTNKLAVRWRAEKHPEISRPEDYSESYVTHAVSVLSIASHVDEALKEARASVQAAHNNAVQMTQSAPRLVRLEKVQEMITNHPFMKIHHEEDQLAQLERVAAQATGGNKGWGLIKKVAGSGRESSSASISNIVSLLTKKSH